MVFLFPRDHWALVLGSPLRTPGAVPEALGCDASGTHRGGVVRAPRAHMLTCIAPQSPGLVAGAVLPSWRRAEVGREAGCSSEPSRDRAINISAYLQKMTQPVSFLKSLHHWLTRKTKSAARCERRA